jgi:RNA polymerase sigma factor (TIGR02999 family)
LLLGLRPSPFRHQAERLLPQPSYPVTELLARWSQGDTAARDALIPLVYGELRRVAARCLAGQANHTLQPTALVHEAYLRLARNSSGIYNDRTHFFALAATMMRQILVDHARKHKANKRGGGSITVPLNDAAASGTDAVVADLLTLEDALQRLSTLDSRQAQIVELRFFGGLSVEETAQMIDTSAATVKREWATARIWLHHAMSHGSAV